MSSHKGKHPAGQCRVCGVFQPDGWTIENLANEPTRESFPEAYDRLIPYQAANADEPSESILQCPSCGLLYTYDSHTPGGSYDAMLTWIVEKIEPVMKHGKHLRKNPPSPKVEYVEGPSEYCCPTCGSGDVALVDAGSAGGEVFFSVKCNTCGDEELLDVYRQGRWLRRKD